MMYATLALMLLLGELAPTADESRRDAPQAVERRAPNEPAKLRCRLYFGCAPSP